MCGSTSGQQEVFAAQTQLMHEMTAAYSSQFGEQQGILAALTKQFEPILAAGPSQEGFSEAEKAALNTQATEGVAQGYKSAQAAVARNLAAQGGGNAFLPSGASGQLEEELASSAANELASEQNKVIQQDYATGRQNFQFATNALAGAAELENPTGAGSAAVRATSAAGTTANEIAAANNAWMGALGGLAGGALGGWASGGFKVPGGGG